MRSDDTTFSLAVFNKLGGPLSKSISLGDGGRPISDASDCKMSAGNACNVVFEGLLGLGNLISGLDSEQALALGQILDTEDGKILEVVVKDALTGAPDQIARSKDHIGFVEGQPGLLLIDFDQKGMPDEIRERITEAGGAWSLICQVVPELAEAGCLRRVSTSAGLRNAETGENFEGSGGEHIYVAVQDAADIPRATEVLHQRLWLAGLGWIRLGSVGQLLERSVVDQSVGSPERLVFEGPPVLVPPLEQSAEARRPVVSEGIVVDTRTALPDLSAREWARFQAMVQEQKQLLRPEADELRERADDRLARELADRTGLGLPVARDQISRRHRGELLPLHPLQFDDRALGDVTVADVLLNPDRYVGETLADPLEGVSYGRNKAKVYRRDDGSLWIKSFAHGGARYDLIHDAGTLRALLQALRDN
jgi:hypothetical protein